jgi:hypothetical protein
MSMSTPVGRPNKAGRPTCPVCEGASHGHTKDIAADFTCYWTQFSRDTRGFREGLTLPLRKDHLIEFAKWVKGNARPRPYRVRQKEVIPPPEARVTAW